MHNAPLVMTPSGRTLHGAILKLYVLPTHQHHWAQPHETTHLVTPVCGALVYGLALPGVIVPHGTPFTMTVPPSLRNKGRSLAARVPQRELPFCWSAVRTVPRIAPSRPLSKELSQSRLANPVSVGDVGSGEEDGTLALSKEEGSVKAVAAAARATRATLNERRRVSAGGNMPG